MVTEILKLSQLFEKELTKLMLYKSKDLLTLFNPYIIYLIETFLGLLRSKYFSSYSNVLQKYMNWFTKLLVVVVLCWYLLKQQQQTLVPSNICVMNLVVLIPAIWIRYLLKYGFHEWLKVIHIYMQLHLCLNVHLNLEWLILYFE